MNFSLDRPWILFALTLTIFSGSTMKNFSWIDRGIFDRPWIFSGSTMTFFLDRPWIFSGSTLERNIETFTNLK